MEAPQFDCPDGVAFGRQYGATPAPYGSWPYDADGAVDEKMASVSGTFGGKGPFMRGRRRRINLLPPLLCVVVPWLLFTIVNAAVSLSIHFREAALCWGIVATCGLAVILAGGFAYRAGARRIAGVDHEPTWLYFLFVSMLVAFAVGFVLGSLNYSAHTLPYHKMKNLERYHEVDVTATSGQQLMDAGVVDFANHTWLDTSKSMGFMNSKVYCVTPIALGSSPTATYDFWAVGVDCCSASGPDFHCPNFNNRRANGGLRSMDDGAHPFFRLAVQQAEAAYNIKAAHPLFFEWSINPEDTVEALVSQGRSEVLVSMFSFFVFQTFFVAVATLAFAKMGFS